MDHRQPSTTLKRAWHPVALAAVLLVGCGADAPAGGKGIAAPAPTEEARDRPELGPIAPVLARIGRHVDVPVGVPSELPEGTLAYQKAYLSNRDGVRRAQLSLRLPGKRGNMVILYGAGGFDGCGPSDPRDVDVNGEPGVVSGTTQGVYSTVVWPARLPDTTGTYAVSGPFPPDEILALARSMDLTPTAPPRQPARSC